MKPRLRLAVLCGLLGSGVDALAGAAWRRPPHHTARHVPISCFWNRPTPPQRAVATGADDVWSGIVTPDELRDVVEEAMGKTVREPIVPQFYPSRNWLWSRWKGTILREVMPREVLWNMLLVSFVWLASAVLMPQPTQIVASKRLGLLGFFGVRETAAATVAASSSGLMRTLASIDKVWLLASGLVSFTLSFFLSQSYALWRSVYSVTRRVQGRLNDIGMLCATAAERHEDGTYTEDAEAFLTTVARYIRLFNLLLYASVTKRFAPLRTPKGLAELVQQGALTSSERDALLQTSMAHNAVLSWLSTLFNSAISDGRMASTPTAGSRLTTQLGLQNKMVELRMTYATILDELTGRMPLAYTQLVQIMVDLLIFCTPFALIHSVGGFGALLGTGLVTLFHSSILNLAKMFLDPFNNDDYGDGAGIAINVGTLLQETNAGSERWRRSAAWVPEATRPRFDRMGIDMSRPVITALAPADGEIIDEMRTDDGGDPLEAVVREAFTDVSHVEDADELATV